MNIQVKCAQCRNTFMARQADRNRGWARYCSKSCKARNQVKREFYKPRDSRIYDDLEDVGHPLAEDYFGHGQN